MRASIFAFFIVILEFPVRDSSSPWFCLSKKKFAHLSQIYSLRLSQSIVIRYLALHKQNITKSKENAS